MNSSPYTTVVVSTVTYAALLKLLQRQQSRRLDDASTTQLRVLIKSVSALHSTATTILALIALNQPWTVPSTQESSSSVVERGDKSATMRLDDTTNPIIAGKNKLADATTAWELGYLIYDTGALFLEANHRGNGGGLVAAVTRLCQKSPIFVAHHAALISALFYLQTYIAAGREKGVWVIVAFLCMNASNPILHLRWWNYKRTGTHNQLIDSALAAVFGLTRFGTVYWVMHKYGQYHGLSALEAMRKQRWQCQSGTSLLTGVNFVWWVALLMQMARQANTRIVKIEK